MSNQDKIIYDLCAGTGAWSEPYRKAGYDVRLITLPDADVRLLQVNGDKIYGVLAAPPCTHLSGSGARWWAEKGQDALLESLAIVDACIRFIVAAKPEAFWSLENPIGRLGRYLGKPFMYFQPYEYGDTWTKKTALWGVFNKPVKNLVLPLDGGKIHRMPPSPERSTLRSITPPGFARAFYEANK